jgi:hypothetical protein
VYKETLLGVDQMGGRQRSNEKKREELMGPFPGLLKDWG